MSACPFRNVLDGSLGLDDALSDSRVQFALMPLGEVCDMGTDANGVPLIDPRIFDSVEFQRNPYPYYRILRDHYPVFHDPLHNTAFALAAMQLMDLTPAHPVTMTGEFADVRAFLASLNWTTRVYADSHKGAGIGSIHALVPALNRPEWFANPYR